ncbi:serpin family protein [Botrimarina mediterranea]|uniref:Serpin (Serine protease inhibitor) n=1 Tax=Botrimarina mediterranea TaxID=2528022 RepID=A0A518KDF9_9BACT|nr:serpin family protein [Botrimarina mediterranea]QDV75831.1 Serpin (serine protease inhibitor) [Botrimarina mediterranea]QDV80428.1 Serpin (serine protease inhibitor) [Planctomycetes bacterium K2D]
MALMVAVVVNPAFASEGASLEKPSYLDLTTIENPDLLLDGSWDFPEWSGELQPPVVTWPGQSEPTPPTKPILPAHVRPAVSPATASAVGGVNDFGFDLFRNLRTTKSDDDNLLVSPMSIQSAFGMTYAGSAGRTAAEMEAVFGFDADTHAGLGALIQDLNVERDGREMRVVNRLFASEQLRMKDDFLAVTRDQYGAAVERLDFFNNPDPARQHINGWVEDQTNDRIKNLLPDGSVSRATSLVLVNALYLNSDWKHGFHESATRDEAFYHAHGAVSLVPTMHQRNKFRYGDFDGYRMLEMPYAGDDLSMVIALPDEIDGLTALESSYSSEQFAADIDAMRTKEVVVSLPKFSFESTERLDDPLKQLGVEAAFSSADFSDMADGGFSIGGVYHKTFIDVNESGTEAAAATAVTVVLTSAYQPYEPPTVFTVDRSFLFAIRDTHTGAVLFLGRMGDPTGGGGGGLRLAELTVPEPTGFVLAGLVLAAAAGRMRS